MNIPSSFCLLFVIVLASGNETVTWAEPSPPTRILHQTEVDLGDRKITYNRVEPPQGKPSPSPSPAIQATPSPIAIDEWARWNAKRHEYLWFSATVYDRSFTELRFWHEGKEYTVWSGIPFIHLAGVGRFETPETAYEFWMGIGEESSEAISAWNQYAKEHALPARFLKSVPPQIVQSTPATASYVFAEPPPEGVPAMLSRQLDDLHQYYRANHERLAREFNARKAEDEERLRLLKENPPVPRDTVINYFPIKSVHADAAEAGQE